MTESAMRVAVRRHTSTPDTLRDDANVQRARDGVLPNAANRSDRE
jgi:hypothetical protein